MYYLYVKTHNKTGLKYLGYTSKDPYKYVGSGKYWKRHIKQHGFDIDTEVIFMSEHLSDISIKGQHYSHLWDIVESNEWANLKEESGQGGKWKGLHGENNPMYGKKRPQHLKDAWSKAKKGIKCPHVSELNSKKRWWTDGTVDKCQIECPPGFYLGRSKMKGANNPVYVRFPTSS
jgi:hypothetical protein